MFRGRTEERWNRHLKIYFDERVGYFHREGISVKNKKEANLKTYEEIWGRK